MTPKASFTKMALLGGNIVTIDEKRPRAQAVYVLGDRIAKVGSDSEIRSLVDNETETIDLKGRTVVPGFVDCHAHPMSYGQQLLNVVLGGTLIQHIPDAVPDALAHEQPNPRDEPGHTLAVTKDTLLHRIVGATEMAVNSAHHQAADKIGEGVVVNAVAPDGVIEGIEAARYRFCLGVQWHPEYAIDAGDPKIFSAFVAAAVRCRDGGN